MRESARSDFQAKISRFNSKFLEKKVKDYWVLLLGNLLWWPPGKESFRILWTSSLRIWKMTIWGNFLVCQIGFCRLKISRGGLWGRILQNFWKQPWWRKILEIWTVQGPFGAISWLPKLGSSSENFLRWLLEKNLAKFLEIVVLVQTLEHLENMKDHVVQFFGLAKLSCAICGSFWGKIFWKQHRWRKTLKIWTIQRQFGTLCRFANWKFLKVEKNFENLESIEDLLVQIFGLANWVLLNVNLLW